jgi:hypothetical protein
MRSTRRRVPKASEGLQFQPETGMARQQVVAAADDRTRRVQRSQANGLDSAVRSHEKGAIELRLVSPSPPPGCRGAD